MRNLFALLAAFFMGLWLAELRQKDDKARLERIIDKLAAKVPEVKEVDRRGIMELIPELKEDLDNFDTQSSLMDHFNKIVRKAMAMELTPLQSDELAGGLIAIASTLAYWERDQEFKAQGI